MQYQDDTWYASIDQLAQWSAHTARLQALSIATPHDRNIDAELLAAQMHYHTLLRPLTKTYAQHHGTTPVAASRAVRDSITTAVINHLAAASIGTTPVKPSRATPPPADTVTTMDDAQWADTVDHAVTTLIDRELARAAVATDTSGDTTRHRQQHLTKHEQYVTVLTQLAASRAVLIDDRPDPPDWLTGDPTATRQWQNTIMLNTAMTDIDNQLHQQALTRLAEQHHTTLTTRQDTPQP